MNGEKSIKMDRRQHSIIHLIDSVRKAEPRYLPEVEEYRLVIDSFVLASQLNWPIWLLIERLKNHCLYRVKCFSHNDRLLLCLVQDGSGTKCKEAIRSFLELHALHIFRGQ